ncbi:hypothetical protein M8C21_025514, partial [Ambrosia artemisiifolia]
MVSLIAIVARRGTNCGGEVNGSLKVIVNGVSDADLYAALKDCNMNPNEGSMEATPRQSYGFFRIDILGTSCRNTPRFVRNHEDVVTALALSVIQHVLLLDLVTDMLNCTSFLDKLDMLLPMRNCYLAYDYVIHDEVVVMLGESDLDLISKMCSLLILRQLDVSFSHHNALQDVFAVYVKETEDGECIVLLATQDSYANKYLYNIPLYMVLWCEIKWLLNISRIPEVFEVPKFSNEFEANLQEDINNLAHGLMLKAVNYVTLPIMDDLVNDIYSMAKANAHISMLFQTHGQLNHWHVFRAYYSVLGFVIENGTKGCEVVKHFGVGGFAVAGQVLLRVM